MCNKYNLFDFRISQYVIISRIKNIQLQCFKQIKIIYKKYNYKNNILY